MMSWLSSSDQSPPRAPFITSFPWCHVIFFFHFHPCLINSFTLSLFHSLLKLLNIFYTCFTCFYRAVLRRVRDCHGKMYVCPSVCPSVTLKYCGHNILRNNFTADTPRVYTLCRPRHYGSTPQRNTPNSAISVPSGRILAEIRVR